MQRHRRKTHSHPWLEWVLTFAVGFALSAYGMSLYNARTVNVQERHIERLEAEVKALRIKAYEDSLHLKWWDDYVRPDSAAVYNQIIAQGHGGAYADSLTRYFIVYGMQVGLSPRLLVSVGHVESRYRRWARSRVGALGVMQVMPDVWWRKFEQECGYWYRGDIRANICYGAHILREEYNRCDRDTTCALAAYNAGYARRRFGEGYAEDVQEVYHGLGG
jgi:hypothetical protein